MSQILRRRQLGNSSVPIQFRFPSAVTSGGDTVFLRHGWRRRRFRFVVVVALPSSGAQDPDSHEAGDYDDGGDDDAGDGT